MSPYRFSQAACLRDRPALAQASAGAKMPVALPMHLSGLPLPLELLDEGGVLWRGQAPM